VTAFHRPAFQRKRPQPQKSLSLEEKKPEKFFKKLFSEFFENQDISK